MSITEIKNIKKLQEMLRSALDEIEYLKECCTKTGEELAKYTFPYDYKEKNLVIQAKKINEEFERREKALDKIEKICKKSSKEWEAYKDETCIFHCKTRKTDRAKLADKILGVIDKVKDGKNDR